MKKHLLPVFSLIIIAIVICTFAYADANHEHSGEKIKSLLTKNITLQFAITALVVSFVLGGLHALTPGHGKAVVAAYLVGSRGRIIDAIFLGLVVTFTHTFSVISIGVILLFAKDRFAQEDVVLWLSLVSGLLIVGIGGWLLAKNMKQYYIGKANSHEHGHDHTHDHSHTHDHTHTHANGHTHSHVPSERTGFWGLLSLGISGGIVPCVDALIGLLFAISLDKLTWGVIILCAFSLGLAAVLVAIGILMVMAKPVIERFTGRGVWLQRLPIISATVVIVLGAVLVFKALNDVGIHI
ncbi:MAG: high frequency lysogenization protein HflD [Candidatus Poribacteria bacterium]|nr:high frequency lysogenization protein HflD [Candidatus Poribacteria bacterium]